MKPNSQLRYLPILIVLFITPGLVLTAYGADRKTYTIGVINLAPKLDYGVECFKKGMVELGYTEGKNITYLYEGATTRIDQIDAVAQRLVAAGVDLILSVTTPATLAAKRATASTDLPVVFMPLTDPVGAGIVESLRNPGGNVTGITFGVQEGRRLEWFVQIAPTIQAVYIPYNPEDQGAVPALEMVRQAAAALGVRLITREIRNPAEIMAAVEQIPAEADAIFLLPDNLLGNYVQEFVNLHVPTSGVSVRDLTDYGVLTSYSIEPTALGKQAARLVNQIFRGVKPADLPVEMGEFYLAINLKAAEALGLDIPDEILVQAAIIVR